MSGRSPSSRHKAFSDRLVLIVSKTLSYSQKPDVPDIPSTGFPCK
ncbi:hypothetical protein HMPREF9137_1890 [Prevotella denticola F0289]|nr:hypothetical protein HMPREF9137_1890 [Prevotella denticola F0289]